MIRKYEHTFLVEGNMVLIISKVVYNTFFIKWNEGYFNSCKNINISDQDQSTFRINESRP